MLSLAFDCTKKLHDKVYCLQGPKKRFALFI